MQTIEEYKEYTAQLEGEVKNWRDAYNASQEHVRQLMKENERLERERVEQNAIIETCANELEELRKHELQWDLDKAKINELRKEHAKLREATRYRKCSEELPNDGETVLVLLGRTPKTRGFFLTSRYVAGGWTYGEDPQGCKPTHWLRIPKAPEAK